MSETTIARDLADYLREHPDVCADISVSAGCHPWVRFHDGDWQYAVFGDQFVEGRVLDEDAVVRYIAGNPATLIPASEAYRWKPSTRTVWEIADDQDVFTDATRCEWCGGSEHAVDLTCYETVEDGDTNLCPECFESWEQAGEIVGETEAVA